MVPRNSSFDLPLLNTIGRPERSRSATSPCLTEQRTAVSVFRLACGETGKRPVPSGKASTLPAELRATRKPRLLFRSSGVQLLRYADRQFLAELFQLPPRFTRFEPHGRSPAAFVARV